MKQNQKGFTLIELLAVIVILAVIALIATPIILNVVSNSKKSAAVDSAYGAIKAVELAYTQEQMKPDGNASAQKITFTAQGGEKVGNTDIKINGDKPTGGIINIDENGDVTAQNLLIGDYYCNSYGTNGKICCETDQGCTGDETVNAQNNNG